MDSTPNHTTTVRDELYPHRCHSQNELRHINKLKHLTINPNNNINNNNIPAKYADQEPKGGYTDTLITLVTMWREDILVKSGPPLICNKGRLS